MSSVFEAQEGFKFLIVETNFKIYAYTNSPLERAILEFIFEIEYIFPGLIIAHITRKSLRNVFKRGVCATKVVYTNLGTELSQHACPSTK
jgi:transcription initiation factor TFIIH subunit 4